MKILYHQKSIFGAGGIERQILRKAAWLVAHGIEVVVAVTDSPPPGTRQFFPVDPRVKVIELGINYTPASSKEYGMNPLSKTIGFIRKRILHRRRLKELLNKERPDILISVYPTVSSFIPSIGYDCPKILEFHFCRPLRTLAARRGVAGLIDRWRTLTDKANVRRFDRFVVLTDDDMQLWQPLDNLIKIPNGIPASVMTADPAKSKKVVAVGRLTRQKGFDRLLKAWQLVKAHDEASDWRLEILGEGGLRPQLTDLAESLGIADSVAMPGNIDDIGPRLADAAIFAASSRYEGHPLSIAEAMAAGLPVATFDCQCGPRELITDGVDGLLVANGEADSLADAILRLILQPRLRSSLGEAARLKITDRFNPERIMQQWIDLFEALSPPK